MMFETQMTAIGRVATAIQLRYVGDGTAMATFRIACTERRLRQSDGTWNDGDSLYMSVTCWRALAEHVMASLSVGDPVIVRGRLRTRQYDKDGRQNSVIELEASAAGPNLLLSTATVTRGRKAPDERDGSGGGPQSADSRPLADPGGSGGGSGAPAQRGVEVRAPVPAEVGVGR